VGQFYRKCGSLRKTTKVSSQHITFPHGKLNPEPCKYEAGVIAALQRRWVQLLKCVCSSGALPAPALCAGSTTNIPDRLPPIIHKATAPLTNIVPRDVFHTEMRVLARYSSRGQLRDPASAFILTAEWLAPAILRILSPCGRITDVPQNRPRPLPSISFLIHPTNRRCSLNY
jgi:hypothetical protein